MKTAHGVALEDTDPRGDRGPSLPHRLATFGRPHPRDGAAVSGASVCRRGRGNGTQEREGKTVPSSLKPLAVGLVQVSSRATEPIRSQARVALAAYAHKEGYCLLETFELDGNAVRDELSLNALHELAGRTGARVLLTRGRPDPVRVQSLTRSRGMRIHAMPGDVL
jgi:hypothetical protein